MKILILKQAKDDKIIYLNANEISQWFLQKVRGGSLCTTIILRTGEHLLVDKHPEEILKLLEGR